MSSGVAVTLIPQDSHSRLGSSHPVPKRLVRAETLRDSRTSTRGLKRRYRTTGQPGLAYTTFAVCDTFPFQISMGAFRDEFWGGAGLGLEDLWCVRKVVFLALLGPALGMAVQAETH